MMSDSHKPEPESGTEAETETSVGAAAAPNPAADNDADMSSSSAAVEPLSAERLSNAFARMLGTDQGSSGDAGDESSASPSSDSGGEIVATPSHLATPPDEDAGEISPKSILEAMLFVGNPDNSPLVPETAARLMRGVEPSDIPRLVDELNREYEASHCPYHVAGRGAGYRMVLRDEYHRLRDKLYGRVRRARLSRAAMDVLAIVAYNQPLTSDEVGRIRETASSGVLAQLVRRRLLKVERRAEKPRKAQYRTTERFLKLFGLERLDDLPRSQELERQ